MTNICYKLILKCKFAAMKTKKDKDINVQKGAENMKKAEDRKSRKSPKKKLQWI